MDHLENGFKELVCKYEGKEVPLFACPSKWWGSLKFSNGRPVVNRYRSDQLNDVKSAMKPRLVVVLESPHKSEFCEQANPIGPAQGMAGKMFEKQFANRVPWEALFRGRHRGHSIVLMNAIEYQCSMGKLSSREEKKQRDLIFRELWFVHRGKEDFKKRLKDLGLTEKDVLINACTQGVTKGARSHEGKWPNGFLNDYVHHAINDCCEKSGVDYSDRNRVTHPSSWRGAAPNHK